MSNISRILSRCELGDETAASELIPVVYDELRKMAALELARERPGQTLQATALVHEVWLKLLSNHENTSHESQGSAASSVVSSAEHSHSSLEQDVILDGSRWKSRAHFFAAAAQAMRRILVDVARKKGRVKRGGGLSRSATPLEEVPSLEPREDIVELDAALERLALVDRTAAELVQLRYFAGLTLDDAAKVLDMPRRTADRRWAFARAWLHAELSDEEGSEADGH